MHDFNLDFHYAMQICVSSNIKRITGLISNIKISFNFKINSFTFVWLSELNVLEALSCFLHLLSRAIQSKTTFNAQVDHERQSPKKIVHHDERQKKTKFLLKNWKIRILRRFSCHSTSSSWTEPLKLFWYFACINCHA